MCTPSCGDVSERGACGGLAILDAFNACLAQSKSFETCISEHSSPALLRRCSRDEPCRDDYICAGSGIVHSAVFRLSDARRRPSGASASLSACGAGECFSG